MLPIWTSAGFPTLSGSAASEVDCKLPELLWLYPEGGDQWEKI